MSQPREERRAPHSVVVVDDHPILRRGVKAALGGSPRLRVIGEAADGLEALKVVRECKPDVVVLDLLLPHLNGLGVMNALSAELPSLKFVAYSLREEPWFVSEALAAGAHAYVFKRQNAARLVEAVEQAAIGACTTLGVVASLEDQGTLVSEAADGSLVRLSKREMETLRLVARGSTAKEAAKLLNVGVRTLETYKSRAMQKLQLRSRLDLTRFAEHSGWLGTTEDDGRR